MTHEQRVKTMKVLTDLYPSLLKMTDTEIALWTDIFKAADFDIMTQCIRVFCIKSQFPPKPSDLVHAYNERALAIKEEIKNGDAFLYAYRSHIGSVRTTEEWVAKYHEYVHKVPAYRRDKEAKRILYRFRQYAEENDWKGIDFVDWIESGGADEL